MINIRNIHMSDCKNQKHSYKYKKNILNYLKKVIGGATTQKNLKTNTKTLIFSIWIRPQGSQRCQKMRQGPLNMPFEVWCANIAPKLKNI
jgi:hypothetical protein